MPGSEPNTARDDRLVDLLERWQTLQAEGQNVSAREVCATCPELAGELEGLARFVGQVETLAGKSATPITEDLSSPPTPVQSDGAAQPVPAPAEQRYSFEGKLGEGGMGTVHRVRDRALDRTVALKVIRADTLSRSQRQRFAIEARAVARLDHPHIVKVFDAGEIQPPGEPEPVPFCTLEFVEGGSLAKRLDGNPLAPATAVRLVALLARAVQHAHVHSIVHRDLKPDNVLLAPASTMAALNTPLGCPKISDFGLARLLSAERRMTQPGHVMGTPAYMAPEQADGQPDIGPPADVWALGVILYELLTGRRPFAAPSRTALLHQIAHQEPPSLTELQPGISAALAALVGECLRKQPAERPTAAQLAERLERMLNVGQAFQPDGGVRLESLTYAREAPPTRRPEETRETERPPRRRSRRLRVGILAGLVVAVLAGLVWRLWPDRQEELPTGPGPGPTAVVRIKPLQVMHYQTVGNEALAKGKLGEHSFATRHGDAVTLTVELSAEAYCYVIGFNFDGKEQLLWPMDDNGSPSVEVAPPRRDRLHLPTGGKRLFLDDRAPSGLQAYVVAASSQPLPPYAQWRAERQGLPWKPLPPGQTVWQADAAGAYAVVPGQGADRGSIREAAGVPPLAGLCRALQSGGVEAVEALAFPVLPKEDQP